MAKNENMLKAKQNSFDEFYTEYQAISDEISHYRNHLKGKVIYCNCDDPASSNFWRYFHNNFASLGLKELISTHFVKDSEPSYSISYKGGDDFNMDCGKITTIYGDDNYTAGDFRSKDCIELLKKADIICTNPPFSLFDEYINQLINNNKNFIIIGKMSAINNSDFFDLLKNNKIWLGYGFENGNAYFKLPEDADTSKYAKGVYNPETGLVKFRNCCWYTNLDIAKRHDGLWHINGEFDKTQSHRYYEGNEEHYSNYYNLDGIDVPTIFDIPIDYKGYMGVPITIMDSYNPDEIELIGTGSQIEKTLTHTVTEAKTTISYINKKGDIVWSCPYSVPERKIGNSLRLSENGQPGDTPFSRIIIALKNPISKSDDVGY